VTDPLITALLRDGLLLAAFGWLLKALVSDKLRSIGADINDLKKGRADDAKKLHGIDNRVVRLEEWRANTGTAGRRGTDLCPAEDCPYEKGAR
jgi:hypothetical protein